LFEINVQDATALPYPVSVPSLLDGRTYAWRVQAIEPQAALTKTQQELIVPVGANEGRSQVFTFTWRTKVRAPGVAVGVGGPPESASGPGVRPRLRLYGDPRRADEPSGGPRHRDAAITRHGAARFGSSPAARAGGTRCGGFGIGPGVAQAPRRRVDLRRDLQ